MINKLQEMAKDGKPIDIKHDSRFQSVCMPEVNRCTRVCYELYMTNPDSPAFREKLSELFCGTVIHETTTINAPVFVDYGCQIEIGENVYIGNNFKASSYYGIVIEDGVQIAMGCTIATVNHSNKDLNVVEGKKVVIKKDAWLGANCTITPGVTIGEGAFVGAGSVVTSDLPDYSVAVGNPARILKYRK